MQPTAKIVADSISLSGKRITTFVLHYHRYLLAEFNTHRVFSRSTASSRAIPISKTVQAAMQDPAMPAVWMKNKPGMQATEEMDPEASKQVELIWRNLAIHTAKEVQKMADLGLHKQTANRPLEWTQYSTTIVTATEWDNFFGLRTHSDAQPEFQVLANAMFKVYCQSEPTQLDADSWHLPLISSDEHTRFNQENLKKFSAARCARVSTLNHDGSQPDPNKDLSLHDRLLNSGHMSPFEHQAAQLNDSYTKAGNFVGWYSYRYSLPNEENITRFKV